MIDIMTRPPLTVLRQFSRAVFADRLIGDELMRMTMARVSIDPASSSSSVVDVMSAFLHSWRMAMAERPAKPTLFSDAALVHALPPLPTDSRLLLLMVDAMGLDPDHAALALNLKDDPYPMLTEARASLGLPSGARALLVEDEPLIAADVRSIVERLGVEVAARASTAGQAVEAAAKTAPDIILADYNLDGKRSGVEAVLEISEFHDCPIVFITGLPDRVLQGDEIEPDFVISKPYTPDNIRAAVVHCLDARRA
ncbi:MAG: response regulator [Pseudomonadota bacterium]